MSLNKLCKIPFFPKFYYVFNYYHSFKPSLELKLINQQPGNSCFEMDLRIYDDTPVSSVITHICKAQKISGKDDILFMKIVVCNINYIYGMF